MHVTVGSVAGIRTRYPARLRFDRGRVHQLS